MLIFALLLVGNGLALAQDGEEEELICPAFPGASTDLRVNYYVGEGMGYAASGRVSSAIYSFSCIVEQINPSYVPGYMVRAALYTQQHDYEEAIADYNRAIELNAGLLAAYNNRGIVYAAQGEYELAMDDFNHVLGSDSGYVIAYNNRAVIYAIQGQYDQAISDLEQAISISGIGGVYAELTNPDRPADAEKPEYNLDHAQPYAVLGIIYSAKALDNYHAYLLLTGNQSDTRIQSAAGALESRFTFELRLDDGTWLFTAAFSPIE
jgi:tetratricopeptide (TPR) repeat protein